MKFVAVFLVCLAVASPVRSQMQKPPITEMSKFAFIVGEWEGAGWMAFTADAHQEARVIERVGYKLGGAVLVLEGIGRSGEPGTDTDRIVHNALGIVSYDIAKGAYTMRAYRADGQYVDAWIEPGENGLTWGFDIPGNGLLRYTIKINEQGQWYEIGEMSRDSGTTWNQFFEMTLDKKM